VYDVYLKYWDEVILHLDKLGKKEVFGFPSMANRRRTAR